MQSWRWEKGLGGVSMNCKVWSYGVLLVLWIRIFWFRISHCDSTFVLNCSVLHQFAQFSINLINFASICSFLLPFARFRFNIHNFCSILIQNSLFSTKLLLNFFSLHSQMLNNIFLNPNNPQESPTLSRIFFIFNLLLLYAFNSLFCKSDNTSKCE